LSPTPDERSLIGRLGAHTKWANEPDRTAATASARRAFEQGFLDQADGDPKRAASLRRAYYARIALRSAQSRRKGRELLEQAEAELHAVGGGDGEPPGGTVAPSIRRNTSAEAVAQPRPEDLTRDAGRLLDACGVTRSRAWVSRTVRDYCSTSVSGLPFGMYLTNRIELNAQQRQAILDRSDLRYLLEYADPTGETACRNVLNGSARE